MESVHNTWELTAARRNSAIGLGDFPEKEVHIFGKGYDVLDRFDYFVVFSTSARSLDGRPAPFPKKTFAELQSFVYKTFPGEDEVEAESARRY